MATSNANLSRRSLRAVRYRKNIRHLSARELNDLRHAFEKLYAISATTGADGSVDPAGNADDERGYQWIAAVHGAPPPVYCQHGAIHFTTWHRAYLYTFEKMLQDQVPGVTLPWWDWADEDSLREGLPAAVTAETYQDLETGATRPNPLFSAYSEATGTMTTRNPRPVSELAAIKGALDFAMGNTEYARFAGDLENPHSSIHVWVRGDMRQVPTAAYDPVFWLHHCNVDRYWYMWQQVHQTVHVPDEALRFVCAPFNMVASSVMSTEALGYRYGDLETLVSAVDVRAAAAALGVTSNPGHGPQSSVTFELDPVPRRFHSAQLEFLDLKPPVDSYLAHIFLNNRRATLRTRRTWGNGYAGHLSLFGHGHCLGGPGHCDVPDRSADPFDLRPSHHLEPASAVVDVSYPLATLVGKDRTRRGLVPVTATLVVEDVNGDLVDPSVLEFEAIALVTKA